MVAGFSADFIFRASEEISKAEHGEWSGFIRVNVLVW